MPKLLFRHKKKEFEGFKNYVHQLETSVYDNMVARFVMASLEDPVYMSWVAKNLIDIKKFLAMPTDEILVVVRSITDYLSILVKAFYKTDEESMVRSVLSPEDRDKYDYECTLFPSITDEQRHQARAALLKAFRSLQNRDMVRSYPWRLPPLEVVRNPKNPAPSNGHFEMRYDEGDHLALKGEMKKAMREGLWEHYYPTGKIFARGEYHEGGPTGSWTFFYADGKKKSEGLFVAGKRQGKWTQWDREGHQMIVEYGVSEDNNEEKEED